MNILTEKFKKRNGYLEADIDAVDRETAAAARDYKKKVAGSFMSITPGEIDLRVKGETLFTSLKIDGELAVIFYEEGNTVAINSGGTVRMGLPPLDETCEALKNAGISEKEIDKWEYDYLKSLDEGVQLNFFPQFYAIGTKP